MAANQIKVMQSLGLRAGLLPSLMVAGLILGSEPASANNCIQDVWKAHGNTQDLTCTANDVSIAQVTNICVADSSQPSGQCCQKNGCTPTCNLNQPVTFTADFQVVLTAQTRYDIGLYLAGDGDPNGDGALTGICNDYIITPGEEVPPSTFVNLDPAPDTCGDIDAGHNPQLLHLMVTAQCVGSGTPPKLRLPNCTSWRQPGSNQVCRSTNDAFPGSPSKCNCQPGFTIDIIVEHPTLSVTKVPNVDTVAEPGGPVTYTVTVTNPAQFTSVTLDRICDDQYGTIATHTGFSCSPAVGPLGPIKSTTCSVPHTIAANNGTYSCTFTATASGDGGQTITDNVCVSGTDSNGNPVPFQGMAPPCGHAKVTIVGVPPSAKVTKQAVGNAVVTFQVQVQNTSTAETATLKALCDNRYGTIATDGTVTCPAATGSIKSTTCGVGGTGNPGTLPATLAVNGNTGDTYTCTFTAEVPVDQVAHTDTVTATVFDDEGTLSATPSGHATVTITTTHNP